MKALRNRFIRPDVQNEGKRHGSEGFQQIQNGTTSAFFPTQYKFFSSSGNTFLSFFNHLLSDRHFFLHRFCFPSSAQSSIPGLQSTVTTVTTGAYVAANRSSPRWEGHSNTAKCPFHRDDFPKARGLFQVFRELFLISMHFLCKSSPRKPSNASISRISHPTRVSRNIRFCTFVNYKPGVCNFLLFFMKVLSLATLQLFLQSERPQTPGRMSQTSIMLRFALKETPMTTFLSPSHTHIIYISPIFA